MNYTNCTSYQYKVRQFWLVCEHYCGWKLTQLIILKIPKPTLKPSGSIILWAK